MLPSLRRGFISMRVLNTRSTFFQRTSAIPGHMGYRGPHPSPASHIERRPTGKRLRGEFTR